MTEILVFILVFVAAFLLGSIPWGVVISRVFFHTDVREHGSGNIGTTNAIRTMGKAGGYAVFLLDFCKGLVSGLLAGFIAQSLVNSAEGLSVLSPQDFLAGAFLACTWGHIFSPWLGFKGGKGIAVAVGCMFVALGPLVALLEIALFALVVIVSRRVSLGSIAAAVACPFFSLYVFWGDWFAISLCVIGALTVLWAHRENIERLRHGTESRVGEKKEKKESS